MAVISFERDHTSATNNTRGDNWASTRTTNGSGGASTYPTVSMGGVDLRPRAVVASTANPTSDTSPSNSELSQEFYLYTLDEADIPDGFAPDGEVEDYAVTFNAGAQTLSGRLFEDNGAGGGTAHNGALDCLRIPIAMARRIRPLMRHSR